MNKYINADAFLLKTSVEIAAEKARKATDIGYHTFLDGFLELTQINLNEMPAADVVEVVRCKDCKYYRSYYDKYKPYYDCPITEDEKHTGECNYIGKRTGVYIQVEETNFCSRGERKETEWNIKR